MMLDRDELQPSLLRQPFQVLLFVFILQQSFRIHIWNHHWRPETSDFKQQPKPMNYVMDLTEIHVFG